MTLHVLSHLKKVVFTYHMIIIMYITDICVMNGKAYTQGQTWYDGCDQVCVCDDGSTGHYTCNQR